MKTVAAACVVACLIGACSSGTQNFALPYGSTPPASGPPSASSPLPSAPIPTAGVTPSDFVAGVDNPLFPLKVGTKATYKGKKEDGPAVQILEVIPDTKTITGVVCTSVRDTLQLNGKPNERVVHWYAQDKQGNVWYLGEADEQFDESGKVVGHDGSWQAGLYGAKAGIVMAAAPAVGATYRQEYYKAHVEDVMEYTDLSVNVNVPYGSFPNAVETKETTRLEVGAVDYKYFSAGVGLVKEYAADGKEGFDLISVTHA